MTAKKFLVYRLISTAILAGVISSSIIAGNYTLAIVVFITVISFLHLMKKKVNEVLEDERDYEIAGKAARYTLTIFSGIAGLISIILFSLRQIDSVYELSGAILAYSVCGLLILYSLIFKFYEKKDSTDYKKFFIIIITAIILIFIVFGIRLFSGEDDWICKDGQWIKHGNPRNPAPNIKCK